MTGAGRLIGSGRSADIFEHGEGRVLRRNRSEPVSQAEVDVMRGARAAGFPAPRVYAVDGPDMVMERIDGVDLLSRLSKRPWEARRIGVMLAGLHRQLASVSAGETDVATVIEPRESLVHGDLHPGNVLLTADGPVVIDWENAGVGARDADVATTWLLLATAEADEVPVLVRPLLGLIRRMLVGAFMSRVDAPRVETVAAVCHRRMHDPNTRPNEIERIRAFASQHAASTAGSG